MISPGPWEFRKAVGAMLAGITSKANGRIIAWFKSGSEEDQRLMAAAPELLEALTFYMMICGNTAASTTRESAQEANRLARAAVAKARGEA